MVIDDALQIFSLTSVAFSSIRLGIFSKVKVSFVVVVVVIMKPRPGAFSCVHVCLYVQVHVSAGTCVCACAHTCKGQRTISSVAPQT